MSIIGLIKMQYGGAVYLCWIGKYPADCDSPEMCQRGYNYVKYRYAFGYAPVWLSLLYLTIVMFVVYVSVRKEEQSSKLADYVEEDHANEAREHGNTNIDNAREERMEVEEKIDLSQPQPQHLPVPSSRQSTRSRTSTLQQTSDQRKAAALLKKKTEKSRRIMMQAFLYVAAVFITHIFSSILRIVLDLNPDLTRKEAVENFFPLLLFGSIFSPLQGLFNCLIYFRYKIARAIKNRRQGGAVKITKPVVQDGKKDFNLEEWLATRNASTPIPMPSNEEVGEVHLSEDESFDDEDISYDEYDYGENDYF
eukprot:CAMPEP_0203668282 /NCGR_PEP_ID=MMETSP0090-20130426/4952_1 /ASSEMBLY_ACC=CAM_ASM_001088 /TAXON_ID=426623 /ORGANISM="Chaetoceros affinis, Strain CCMP159" /LENGTH=307 /DNA_ID=CAMNT_0050532681 /DNA_START=471 /DNA_END=1394 /DNA_ORIENTATION=+